MGEASDPTSSMPLSVWLMPEQADLVSRIAAEAGMIITAVGTPAVGRAQELSARFEAKPLDDLRAAISGAQPGLFLLASVGSFGRPGQQLDADVLLAARDRGVRILSFEPLPAALGDLTHSLPPAAVAPDDAGASGAARSVAGLAWTALGPPARSTSPVCELMDLLPSFGPVRTASIQCFAAPIEGSLGARLLDAMDLAFALLGEPESIDASYANPLLTRNLHATPGEALHDLRGDLTANIRFPGGRSCVILASDQAAAWDVAVTLIGPAGRLTATSAGVRWLDAAGNPVNSAASPPDDAAPASRAKPRAVRASAPASRITDLADLLRLLRDQGIAAAPSHDIVSALSMAQAALLSARTGEGESPATMLKMASV